MSYHYVMKIAYKGTNFLGWQKTKEGSSIEETLETILKTITQEQSVSLQAASRTDKGVHAVGQIVDFKTEKPIRNLERLKISLNQLLPSDISCIDIASARRLDFHPTLSAIQKRYQYSVTLGSSPCPFNQDMSWHVHMPLHRELMIDLAKDFYGTHDFYGFCNQRADLRYESTIRTLSEVSMKEETIYNWDILTFTLVGDKFLYKMARNIVGTLIWVGANKIPYSQALEALRLHKRILAGVTAPAHGLTLVEVIYPYELFS